MALLLVSHDLGVIARRVARTLVMYGGSLVEVGPTAEVFAHPRHPYTRGLLAARPTLRGDRHPRLPTIAGTVPALADLPAGCPFAGRCPHTIPACHITVPAPAVVGPAHEARCIRLGELE